MDSNWVLVIITAIYVGATIGILFANNKSAKTAEEQLQKTKDQMDESRIQFEKQMDETKRQYEETKRLSIMPYFQCDISTPQPPMSNNEKVIEIRSNCKYGTQHQNVFEIKNIGLGTAKDIRYRLVNLSGTMNSVPFIFQSALSGERHINSLMFIIPFDQKTSFSVYFDLTFRDLLDNDYSQRIEFKFIRDERVGTYKLETITHSILTNPQESNHA